MSRFLGIAILVLVLLLCWYVMANHVTVNLHLLPNL
jgi:hypothetical protein